MCGGVEVGGEPSAPFQCRQVTQSSNEESSQDATEDDWEEWEKGSETELDGGEYIAQELGQTWQRHAQEWVWLRGPNRRGGYHHGGACSRDHPKSGAQGSAFGS